MLTPRGRRAAAVAVAATLTLTLTPAMARADGAGQCWIENGKTVCKSEVKTPPTPGGRDGGGGGGGEQRTGGGYGPTFQGGGGGGVVNPRPAAVRRAPTVAERFRAALNSCVGETRLLMCAGQGVIDLTGSGHGSIGLGVDPLTGLPVFNWIDQPAAAARAQPAAVAAAARAPAAPTVTPEQLAQMARAKITLPKPTIGSAPCTTQGCMGAVGVPVWLWTDPGNWITRSDSASAGGLTVTVTAQLQTVTWAMGDGATIVCTTPGTRYDADEFGWAESPDCGHVYQKTSRNQPGGRYTIQAVATYDVSFSGAYTGTVHPSTTSSVSAAIGEYQAIVVK